MELLMVTPLGFAVVEGRPKKIIMRSVEEGNGELHRDFVIVEKSCMEGVSFDRRVVLW